MTEPTKSIDELHKQLKTAYELARAATATEEGKKAIDFFYHVHLNSYPGFARQLFTADRQQLLDRVEKSSQRQITDDGSSKAFLEGIKYEQFRTKQALAKLRKELG